MENSNQNNNPQSEIKDLNQPQENVPEKEAENKVTDLNYYENLKNVGKNIFKSN